MAALTERVQSLQSELDHSELRREELEAELTNTQEVRRRCAHIQVIHLCPQQAAIFSLLEFFFFFFFWWFEVQVPK